MESLVTVPIRYDGLDADKHVMPLDSLAESLIGMSKVINICANYAVTGRVIRRRDLMVVRTYATEIQGNCITIQSLIQFAAQHQLLAGVGTSLICGIGWLIAYQFASARAREDEVQALKETLIKSIEAHENTSERLINALERSAQYTKSPVRESVNPIGINAETMTVGNDTIGKTVIGRIEKEEILSDVPLDVTEQKEHRIIVYELNHPQRHIRFWFENSEDQKSFTGEVSDPVFLRDDNVYKTALGTKKVLIVTAKATINYDNGDVHKLFISNAKIDDKI